jgi:hypothetical protein
MDLETYNPLGVEDGKLVPYLLCWFDGTIKRSYWQSNYPNFDSLLKQVIQDFSRFDGIFLLKILASFLSEGAFVDPIIHNGKFISIQFYYNV